MMNKDEEEKVVVVIIDKLEAIARQLNKANNTFNKAYTATGIRRKELLEEALKEYADILPLLTPYRNKGWGKLVIRTVLDKIHVIERWIESEIANTVLSSSTTTTQQDIALAETRLAVD